MSASVPNNGAPKSPPDMDPQERIVWLALRGCPSHYRLLTLREISMMEAHLRRATVFADEFKATVAALDQWGYWQGNPDVKTAVANAAFDARKFERAVTHAITALERTVADWALNEKKDAAFIANPLEILEALAFLKAQAAARREEPQQPTPEKT